MRTLYVTRGNRTKSQESALRAKFLRPAASWYQWILGLLTACSSSLAVSDPQPDIAPASHSAFAPAPALGTASPLAPAVEALPTSPTGPASKEAVGEGTQPPAQSSIEGAPIQVQASRLWETPVSHLTAGKRRGAALVVNQKGTAELYVFSLVPNSKAGHPSVPLSKPAPSAFSSPQLALGLFMGRDDWPRVITTGGATGDQHYFRFRPGPGWESPRDEQGALAKAGLASGFYGVLGHDDPEVLCAPQGFCYEKRQTGWQKRALPGDGAWIVRLLSNGEVWAWGNSGPWLCQLKETWNCTLPHPGVPVLSMAYVNGKYLALTSSGLMSYDNAWALQASLTNGRSLLKAGTGALVLDSESVWFWDGQLHRLHSGETPLTGGCCLESPTGSPRVFIIGGEHGVTRVTLD